MPVYNFRRKAPYPDAISVPSKRAISGTMLTMSFLSLVLDYVALKAPAGKLPIFKYWRLWAFGFAFIAILLSTTAFVASLVGS